MFIDCKCRVNKIVFCFLVLFWLHRFWPGFGHQSSGWTGYSEYLAGENGSLLAEREIIIGSDRGLVLCLKIINISFLGRRLKRLLAAVKLERDSKPAVSRTQLKSRHGSQTFQLQVSQSGSILQLALRL